MTNKWINRENKNGDKISTLDEVRSWLQKDKLSYAQCLQDVFALMINDYKFGGTCLDIGSSAPWERSGMLNNTLLLQLYDWKAVCVDLNDFTSEWSPYPNAKFYSLDCTNCDNVQLVLSSMPKTIDYLSLDIDDYTINGLRCIDFNEYKFKCITIEHNKYLGDRGNQRFKQREILSAAGYTMVIKNWTTLEDWWINPDLVDYEKFKYLEQFNDRIFCPTTGNQVGQEDFMDEDILAPDHRKKIEQDASNFNKKVMELMK